MPFEALLTLLGHPGRVSEAHPTAASCGTPEPSPVQIGYAPSLEPTPASAERHAAFVRPEVTAEADIAAEFGNVPGESEQLIPAELLQPVSAGKDDDSEDMAAFASEAPADPAQPAPRGLERELSRRHLAAVYASVNRAVDLSEAPQPPALKCQLRPYQRQALSWLCARELAQSASTSSADPARQASNAEVRHRHPLWEEYAFADGDKYFLNPFSMCASVVFPASTVRTSCDFSSDRSISIDNYYFCLAFKSVGQNLWVYLCVFMYVHLNEYFFTFTLGRVYAAGASWPMKWAWARRSR